jgi:hypothetical protein
MPYYVGYHINSRRANEEETLGGAIHMRREPLTFALSSSDRLAAMQDLSLSATIVSR